MFRRRRTKKTRLIHCEGAHDQAFLSCVKAHFASDMCNVDIKRGTGGDQVHLVEEAHKRGSVYGEAYVKLDGDRPSDEMAAADALALELGVSVLRSTPATEYLLIKILEPSKRIASWDSKRLKQYFEEKYIPSSKRTDVRAYMALFTKEVLEEAMGRVPELRDIVRLF